MRSSTGPATNSPINSFSNFFTHFFYGTSTPVAGAGNVTCLIRPAQTDSGLLALPIKLFSYLLRKIDDPCSALLLSTTCSKLKYMYEDVKCYQDYERQSHILMYNLETPVLRDKFYAKLFLKKFNKVAIPEPYSLRWISLRSRPLSARCTERAYRAAFIQKTYITAWELLLQPTVLSNQSQVLELMRVLLALLPYISNANTYASKLFEDTLPRSVFKKLINIDLDGGLQLLCRHFPMREAQNFAVKWAPSLPIVIEAVWQEIHNGQYKTFLHCALECFSLFFTDERLTVLLIQLFLRPGTDYNLKDREGNTALMLACKYNQLALVKLLLQQANIDVNIKNDHGLSAVDYAVKYGTVPLLQVLLMHGVDADLHLSAFNQAIKFNKIDMISILWQKANVWGKRPFIQHALIRVIIAGETRVVDRLIKDYAADPNTASNTGLSILRLALQKQDILLLDTLLRCPEFTINIAKGKKGRAALMYALVLQDFSNRRLAQLIKRLFEQGEDCNAQDKQGNTPLILACMHDQQVLIKILLHQVPLNINVTNHQGLSALDYAIRYSTVTIVQALLTHGVNLDLRLTAFNHAVKFKKDNMVSALLPTAKILEDIFIHHALIHAITAGESRVAYTLIKDYAVNPNTVNHFGVSAFILALQKQDILLLNTLLQYPALKLTIEKDQHGKTALHYALALRLYPNQPLVELVKRLIAQGADCNVIDAEGNTPLILACKYNRQTLIPLLLQRAHIEVNARNNDGFSALDYVIKYGTVALAQSLLHSKINSDVHLSAFNYALQLKKDEMIDVLWQKANALGNHTFIDQALAYALEKGQQEVTKILCSKYGAHTPNEKA
jgi:ankyrin repeat protein